MAITHTFNVEDGVSESLVAVIRTLDGAERAWLNEVAGRAVVNAAIEYHLDFDGAGGWRGKPLPRAGTEGRRGFRGGCGPGLDDGR